MRKGSAYKFYLRNLNHISKFTVMFTKDLTVIYEKNLLQLKQELELFKDEKNIWLTAGNISNSAGNLCLHLTGNLNHFIGAGLGNTGYVRNRDAEFSLKNVSRTEMISQIDATIEMLKKVLPGLSEDELGKDSPKSTPGREMTVGYLLLHLLAHFNYHLGQINYLRRVLEV